MSIATNVAVCLFQLQKNPNKLLVGSCNELQCNTCLISCGGMHILIFPSDYCKVALWCVVLTVCTNVVNVRSIIAKIVILVVQV